MEFNVPLTFIPDSMAFDPDRWILAKSLVMHQSSNNNQASIVLYPNPARDFLTFRTPNLMVKKAELFDITGKLYIAGHL